jgi:SAM-dependent methyltransferase
MNDWTAGYVTSVDYTFGYYPELNPLYLRLALPYAGLQPSEIRDACELGFGQGLSLNFHAAGSAVRWFGTDFNPAHAALAQEMARASGAGAQLFDESFEAFCARPDLPEFDFIGLHGIWSWIPDEARAQIVRFAGGKLRPGGVLYVSYNTPPGWAAMAPMRELFLMHKDLVGAPGQGILAQVDAALDFAEKLLAANTGFARAHPVVAERVAKLKGQDRTYLAHEYFNRSWSPMSIARTAEWLADAKLTYACSATLLDHVDAVNLLEEQRSLLGGIRDPIFRELVRDFCVNQAFRRDYWVKGARKLSPVARKEALRAWRVMLIKPRAEVPLKVTGNLGEATLHEDVYKPILDLLADHRPAALGQLESALAGKQISLEQIAEAVMVLAGAAVLVPVQDDDAIAAAKPSTDRLGTFIRDKARGHNDIRFVASPVTGGGIVLGRFHQLFLLARDQGRQTPAEWARFAWDCLDAQGERIVKDGAPLQSADENLRELTTDAGEFAAKILPILQALAIA